MIHFVSWTYSELGKSTHILPLKSISFQGEGKRGEERRGEGGEGKRGEHSGLITEQTN